MKIRLLACMLFCFACIAKAQTILFFDDFESGISNWNIVGDWNVTNAYAYSGTYSFNESPAGIYTGGIEQIATMDTAIDLTTALDADVQFYALLDLEEGFDFMYLDASPDGGVTWINIGVFNGEGMLTDWQHFTFGLGAFVGNPDVRLRFRFEPDMAVEYDGMFIDDFTITKYNVDVSPPLILHTPLNLYEGTIGPNPITADILDASGLASTTLYYSTDGSAYYSIAGINTTGDEYLFTIPELTPGTFVDYYFAAVDDFLPANTAISDTFSYIAGNYIKYDNGVVNFVNDIGETAASGYDKAAVKISLLGATDLVSVVIQNYTDNTRPNDSIEIHIWNDAGGFPGTDLITPFKVFPECTLEFPNKGTRVDLRPYSADLSGISGDIYIGFMTPGGTAWVSQTTPGIASRTYVSFPAFGWLSITDDYHFRAITSAVAGAPDALFSYDIAAEPTSVFTDLSTGSPTSWSWDFGDGTTSTEENPTHLFETNGSFNVCLTATNAIGSTSYCDIVEINSYIAPAADFSSTGDPDVSFTDLSLNIPTAWNWDFGDGGYSTLQNPMHTYAANGIYNVCLTASNVAGSDIVCKEINIISYPSAPVADFSYAQEGATITFTDESAYTPTSWNWNFGDGSNATLQNPVHTYTALGNYTVCLSATNGVGTDSICKQLSITDAIVSQQATFFTIYPNPAVDYLIIDAGNLGSEKKIRILNATGQIIKEFYTSSNQTEVDVSQFKSGIYILYLDGGDISGTKTFVIEK